MRISDWSSDVCSSDLFPKKLAQPSLAVETDTLVGTLDYGSVRIATGTLGYKHRALDAADEARGLCAPNYLLKVIPHVDGSTRVCELVRFHLEDVTLKGAWTGPAALQLCPHALAPVADLPELGRAPCRERGCQYV